MDSPQNIKKRLKSVANINKITKAMELVAATKMRRAQEIALNSRPYALTALDLLANVSLLDKHLPTLFMQRRIKKVLFVLVASDKGLAGAFNSALFKKFEKHIAEHKEKYAGEEKVFIAVGEKSFQYLKRKGFNMVKKPEHQALDAGARPSTESEDSVLRFVQVGDHTTVEQVQPLADFIVEGYLEKKWDRVVVFSTHFKSALKQEPLVRRVLPVDFDHIKEIVQEITPTTGKFAELIKEQNIQFAAGDKRAEEYTIEPSSHTVLEDLAKHLLFMQVYHLILEANASEHSARRLAMKTASDNAADLSETLNLQYNKSRQSAITTQIIEISSGAEALS